MRASLLVRTFIAVASLLTIAQAKPAPVLFDSFEYTGRDTAFVAPLVAGQYRNPILAGFYPDPSLCRVGDDYYLVNSTFGYFPGLPIFHSRDLVHWTQLGHAIDRPGQLKYDGIGVTRGLFAPALSHHGDTFYLVCTMIDGGGNFLLTAKNPAGPWSDPIWLHFDGIDPSIFFDDDGRAWLVNNGNPPDNKPLYSGHRAIWIQEFDIAAQKLTGPRSIIVNGGADISKKPVWIEGPHLFKRGAWYYLCCAEGGTSDQHSQVILRSKSPTGPFAPWEKNPILTQRDLDGTVPGAITCTGHADLIPGPNGQWWATFLGCRPFAGKQWTTGRETFLLPVTWTDDGWPQILPPGQRVPTIAPAPKIAPDTAPVPLTGNFTWRDDFSAPTLSPLWLMLRTPPADPWLSLTAAPGHLALTPRSDLLSGKTNPTFLARRLQHSRFDATVALAAPIEPHVTAGLAVLQSETHTYFLAVRRTDSALEVIVECANGQPAAQLAHAPLPANTKDLQLRLTGEETKLTFAYATAPDHWQTLLADADVTPITNQAAGGGLHFTGAVIGLHARLDP